MNTSIDTTVVKRLDAIFSAADSHAEGARNMNAEFIIIPRNELPEVTLGGDGFLVEGSHFRAIEVTAAARRAHAFRQIAIAEYLDAQAAS